MVLYNSMLGDEQRLGIPHWYHATEILRGTSFCILLDMLLQPRSRLNVFPALAEPAAPILTQTAKTITANKNSSNYANHNISLQSGSIQDVLY